MFRRCKDRIRLVALASAVMSATFAALVLCAGQGFAGSLAVFAGTFLVTWICLAPPLLAVSVVADAGDALERRRIIRTREASAEAGQLSESDGPLDRGTLAVTAERDQDRYRVSIVGEATDSPARRFRPTSGA
ncbi:MAG: hypothetical protein IPK13_03075 [Deltaproteobacteria bacterium]|nr:hypothetical protein [Deltaproteobacteria bacterium]